MLLLLFPNAPKSNIVGGEAGFVFWCTIMRCSANQCYGMAVSRVTALVLYQASNKVSSLILRQLHPHVLKYMCKSDYFPLSKLLWKFSFICSCQKGCKTSISPTCKFCGDLFQVLFERSFALGWITDYRRHGYRSPLLWGMDHSPMELPSIQPS